MLPDFLTPAQVAEHLAVAQGTVYLWVKQGSIPHYKLGKAVRFDPQELQEWLEARHNAARRPPALIAGQPGHLTTYRKASIK